MTAVARVDQTSVLDGVSFDVLIVGGGINGACLYHHLCQQGYRVLLVEKGDFACGTSQASAMMIWGGLMYLRNAEFLTVRRLCSSRERLVRQMGEWVRAREFRYVPVPGHGRSPRWIHAALYVYWLLGGCRRAKPRVQTQFGEQSFLNHGGSPAALSYEEARVEPSDARFVLQWLLGHCDAEHVALNHCALADGAFDPTTREWTVELEDALCGLHLRARARWVINAAGVWTDTVNDLFGMVTPWKHVLSKGVWLGLPRHLDHQTALLFETRTGGDVMTLMPWGPIALWGPTETLVDHVEEGFTVTADDVRFLLDEVNRQLRKAVTPGDIVSLRCGVRPLAAPRSYRVHANSWMELSRRHYVHVDRARPWISLYGGKLTSCVTLATEVSRLLGRRHGRPTWTATHKTSANGVVTSPRYESYPTLREPVVDARWSLEHEMCWRLDDYLRRRTNVAQWVARGGLGRNGEHRAHVASLAATFARDGGASAGQDVAAYQMRIEETLDRVLSEC